MDVDMSKRLFAPVALGFYLLAPALLHAQSSLGSAPSAAPASPQVGGKLTVDLVTVNPNSLGLTLRHGSVAPGSEQVQYNGHRLQTGQD